MSVVQRLRQNDPARKFICIDLRLETSDADLAEALEQNPFVTEIILDLEGLQRTDWDSLLRVIAMRANLATLTLQDAGVFERRNAPAALVRSILRAIQQNMAIESVELKWFRLPTDISSFLVNSPSITFFGIRCCDMDPAERQQGARSLAAAIHRNTNIETLGLGSLADIYSIPILEGLGSNVSLKTLIFSPSSYTNASEVASHALHQLLESTTSIQRFELRDAYFSNEQQFRPITHGIINSECVSELKLSDCRFHGSGIFAQLQSILLNKRNLTSLCLDECHFDGGQVHEDIISMLLRPDSSLRCFEYQSFYSLEGHFPRIQFETLLQAIQKSKLERFKIGTIQTQQQLQALTRSIPLMQIKELEVSFWGDIVGENANPRQNLLLALKNNFSLWSVKGEMQNDDLFGSAEDKQRLAFYANRTMRVWINGPTIPRRSKSKKFGPRHWVWRRELDPMLCFAGCARSLGVIP